MRGREAKQERAKFEPKLILLEGLEEAEALAEGFAGRLQAMGLCQDEAQAGKEWLYSLYGEVRHWTDARLDAATPNEIAAAIRVVTHLNTTFTFMFDDLAGIFSSTVKRPSTTTQ